MKIKVIKINQDGNVFYVGKILAKDLVRIATTKVRKTKTSDDYKDYLSEVGEIVENEINKGNVWYLKDFVKDSNIQRRESKERLKQIGEFISKSNSLFPNAIICNISPKADAWADYDYCNQDNFVKIENDILEFNENNVEVTIIDGQHRLGGFRYSDNPEYYLENYELIITIMIGLEPAQQAELFSTINGKQRVVNKSVLYDMSSMSEKEYTEQVTAHLITSWFNINEKSPLLGKIKMLGIGDGTISQAAMIEAIIPLLKKKKVKYGYSIEDNLMIPIFSEEFEDKNTSVIIQNLYDYFKCFQKIFYNEWNYNSNSNDKVRYILNKTTGISGILIAYPTIYTYLARNENIKNEVLLNLINKLKLSKFDPTSYNYSGGSKQIQKKFALDILGIMFDNTDIVNIRNEYIKRNLFDLL